jgi:hypothetical protein
MVRSRVEVKCITDEMMSLVATGSLLWSMGADP